VSWQVELLDAAGEALPREGGLWTAEEKTTVKVRVHGPPCTVWAASHPLPWRPELPGVELELPYAVGRLDLQVRGKDETRDLPLRVLPAGHKLGAALWSAMLADLEAWLAGVGVGVEAPAAVGVGVSGVSSAWLVQAVLPLLPALESALAAVLQEPRLVEEDRLTDVPLHRTRAADAETLAWLSSHPTQAAWLDPHRAVLLSGTPPHLPVRTTHDTVNHPANQHVAWVVQRVVARLREVARQLAKARHQELNQTATWALARAASLTEHADRLDRLRRTSWLREVRQQAASETAMLVVLDHPTYARLHQLARRVLSTALAPEEAELSAPVRPSFELYELWCFLELSRRLRGGLADLDLRWKMPDLRPLLRLDGRQPAMELIGANKDIEVRLDFQPHFRGYLSGPGRLGRVSLTAPRVPDLTLAARRGSHAAWVVFDAKYSSSAGGLGLAFESAHLYRDALSWPAYGGRPRAGLLLAPRVDPAAAIWSSSGFREAHGLGVLALRPGTDAEPSFLPWLRDALQLPALETIA
jgi:hypothetical protein